MLLILSHAVLPSPLSPPHANTLPPLPLPTPLSSLQLWIERFDCVYRHSKTTTILSPGSFVCLISCCTHLQYRRFEIIHKWVTSWVRRLLNISFFLYISIVCVILRIKKFYLFIREYKTQQRYHIVNLIREILIILWGVGILLLDWSYFEDNK